MEVLLGSAAIRGSLRLSPKTYTPYTTGGGDAKAISHAMNHLRVDELCHIEFSC